MKVSPKKAAVAQQLSETAKHAANTDADAILRQMRFAQGNGGEQESEERDDRHGGEHRAPAERDDQRAAGERREDRRDAEHQHAKRHQPRRLDPGMQVADDRTRNHHHGRGSDALHEAEENQPLDAGRKAAADRAGGEQREPEIQRRLAADHVGDRAINDLADAEGDEEAHQRHLRRGDRGMQIRRDGGKRGEIHVDRERADRREQAEDEGILRKACVHFHSMKLNAAGLIRPRYLFVRRK